MIPRYQKILFVMLLIASLAMGVVLWQSTRARPQAPRSRAKPRPPPRLLRSRPPSRPRLSSPTTTDNSLVPQVHSLPLPADPGARARAVLGRLLDLYAAPDATHPVPGGAASVTQVFLSCPLAARHPTESDRCTRRRSWP